MKRANFSELLVILVLAAMAHIALFLPLPLVVQTLAALVLTGLLPGWLLVEWLVGQSEAPPILGERVLYAIAAAYGVIVVVMLGVSYLPGPVARWQSYLAFDLVLLILLVFTWWRRVQVIPHASGLVTAIGAEPEDQHFTHAKYAVLPIPRFALSNWLVVGLATLLLLGGFFRFANLGYAEFHGDESRAVLRAAGVIQGYEDVLFLHKKGPAEILVPAMIFSLTGHLDETNARLPFAIANLAALFAVFLLGWRLVGPLAGWAAAFLLCFDGYLIAFARFVQYQSIVLLTSVLVVVILYRLVRQPKALAKYFTLAAILFATGLLAHYDAAIAVIPAAFLLLIFIWQQRPPWLPFGRALLPALLVGAVLLASFYVPFIRHPHFAATTSYFNGRFDSDSGPAEDDGPLVFHNSLADFFRRSIVYNSIYAELLMIGLVTLALILAYRKGWKRALGSLLGLLAALLIGATFWRAEWLKIGATDLIIVPFALAMLLIWVAPRLKFETRLLWLWFGAAMLLAFFFTATPRTHVYIFFVPWALLVGDVIEQGWHWLRQRVGQPMASTVGNFAAVAVALVFGLYAYWYFVYDRVEVLRTWETNRPAGYWTPYDAKQVDSLYGFPLTNGWKVIGALYAQGVLQGDYETNQRYVWIPDWYTRGQHRCDATANWYFAIDTLEPWAEDSKKIADRVKAEGFRQWGVVDVQDAPRLLIYKRTEQKTPLQTFRLDDYTSSFATLARPDLALEYPVIEDKIGHPLHVNFDNKLWLEGYDIAAPTPLKPSDTFRLTLYWRAQQVMDKDYKVFNQSYYGNGTMVAQKDGYSVCNREPTTTWSPGKLLTDVYDIPVAGDAPDGIYPLYTGMYLEQTQERLPVLDEAGKTVDNQAHVADLKIKATPP